MRASFPAKQSIAKHERLLLTVRNSSSETIPNIVGDGRLVQLRVELPGTGREQKADLGDRTRPGRAGAARPCRRQEVSIPGGGQTAYVNTWALGVLPAHRTATFFWSVVPVKAGAWTVRYAFSAGLAGKAKARLAAGGPAAGHFHVVIAPKPPETHVDPKTGQVVPGPYAGNKAELGP